MIAESGHPWPLLGVIWGVLIVMQLVEFLAARKRREGWRQLAESRGCTYTREDPSLISLDPKIFGSRGLKKFFDVISGQHAGIAVKRFLLFKSSGRYSITMPVVSADLSTSMPRMIVTREFGPLHGRHPDLQRFEGGEGPFRQTFDVWTSNPAFAAATLAPPTTDWMLSLKGVYGFEVSGDHALAYGGSGRPRDIDKLIEACIGFVQRLPSPTAEW